MSNQNSFQVPAKESFNLKVWLLALRPKTLSISVIPVIVGTAFASSEVVHLNWFLICMALLCSLSIQIGTNLINDAYDFKKGADGPGRLGPIRVTQNGLLTFKAVLTGAYVFFALAAIFGSPLVISGGWPLLIGLLLSAACGYLYTAGPLPLAYIGCSDLFILIFFGWVSTCCIFYLQTHSLNFSIFFAGTQIGLLAIVPHAINNLRDHVADAIVRKKTLAVRFGSDFVKWEITFLAMIPFIMGFFWIQQGHLWMGFLPTLILIPTLTNIKAIWVKEPSSEYNYFLARSAACQFAFGSLLALGALIR